MTGILGFSGCASDPAHWSDAKLESWFSKGDWLNGWDVKPDASVNKREFAISYFKNRDKWDKAFTFLKTNDLKNLEIKRYDIDGDIVYAPVSEYMSKNEGDAHFEAHRKYIDIQYVIKGVEQIGVSPISKRKNTVTPYDDAKDIEFMTVTDSTYSKASQDNFFIFFPSDSHKPGMKIDSVSPIKKIVVKVKAD
jgi:biofilm protein TabA